MYENNNEGESRIDHAREAAYEQGEQDAPLDGTATAEVRDANAMGLYPDSARLRMDYCDGWETALMDAEGAREAADWDRELAEREQAHYRQLDGEDREREERYAESF